MQHFSLIEAERVYNEKPRVCFEIYQRNHGSNHFWQLTPPDDAFRWLRGQLLEERILYVEITGHLGKTVPDTKISSRFDLYDLWKRYFTQALQSHVALLAQRLVFTC